MLDEDSADDPAILHHTLSKLPFFAETPAAPSTPPTRPIARSVTSEDEEDLMSSRSRSDSFASGANSFLNESMISLSASEASSSTIDLSLDALDDSMLSDPDVTGLAFSSPPRAAYRRQPSPPSSPPPYVAPTASIDDLITRALELWHAYPLVGDSEGAIAADEVMGPKSCVFTWPLSVDGLLDDAGADEIAAKGVDIVLHVMTGSGNGDEKLEEQAAADFEREQRRRRRMEERVAKRRKVELGVGAALAVVGVAGVLMAVYGAEWRGSAVVGKASRWDLSAMGRVLGRQ